LIFGWKPIAKDSGVRRVLLGAGAGFTQGTAISILT